MTTATKTTDAGARTQPTPGPWEVHRGLSSTHATPIRWKGENLAWVCGLDSAHEFSLEQTLANARLIAASPDLMDAALDVEAAGRPHGGRSSAYPDGCECEQCEAWDKLVRAITAAEGRAA